MFQVDKERKIKLVASLGEERKTPLQRGYIHSWKKRITRDPLNGELAQRLVE